MIAVSENVAERDAVKELAPVLIQVAERVAEWINTDVPTEQTVRSIYTILYQAGVVEDDG